MQPIPVRLGTRSYLVRALRTIADLSKEFDAKPGRDFALIDSNVDKLHGETLRKALPHAHFFRIASGEKSKSFMSLEKTANALVDAGATRASRLVAIGGGVVGDLTGFLAGVFMRGIPFIQIPTTLLAMVDSSVGGKTAVNLKSGKNLVGVFHQPQAVFVIPEFLQTLPVREVRCGLSEAVKTALIQDASMVAFLEKETYNEERLDTNFLAKVAHQSIRIKAKIVSKDEKEQNIRAFLNFGHTLAHALEALTEYKGLLHGEAVAIGMRFAALLSRRMGYLSLSDETRIQNLLQKYTLPQSFQFLQQKRHGFTRINPTMLTKLIRLMHADKKNDNNTIKYVLLDKVGRARLPQGIEEKELLASLKEFLTLA